VATLALVNPPTRGVYAILPRHDQHRSAPQLLHQLMMHFRLGPVISGIRCYFVSY
jgi:hypothetical protein